MRHRMETGGLALCATVMAATLAAQGAGAPKAAVGPLCDACLEVCSVPLSYEDDVLDESTDSYVPAAPREIATAAAIEMATRLKGIYGQYKAGHFGRAYEVHAGDIESLARKQAQVDHATSAEIRALRRVRTALYADTVVGLRSLPAAASPPQELLAAYRAREAVLDGVLASMAASPQMRAAERLAVCEVLAAHRR
jgi:hypothetical protein